MGGQSDRRVFTAALLALCVLAWAALGLWGASPHARYLGHAALSEVGDRGSYMTVAALFVVGWTLMIAAMMLPTTLPLVFLFRSVTARRRNRLLLTGLLLLGYLTVWTAFGVAAHLADGLLHLSAALAGGFAQWFWLPTAAPLLAGGAYQFSSLQRLCLDQCRSPRSFIMERWKGGPERTQAFLLGVRHGLFCVGCCWPLMLLMFAVGAGNLAWMFLLGAIMAIEKNARGGQRLAAPIGVLLLALGAAVAVTGALGGGTG